MGAIYFRRIELVSTLNELVGYKAGVALTREQMQGFLKSDGPNILDGNDDASLRVRSEEFEEIFCRLLYEVGNIKSPEFMPSIYGLYRRFEKDQKLLPVYIKVQEFFNRFCEQSFNSDAGPIDLTVFVEQAKVIHGVEGQAVELVIAECVVEDMHKSSLGAFRQIQWNDTVGLADLFASEKLSTIHGEFFDQRFVDYLSHNFDSIDKINWRKFEGLTCEFFHRAGLRVEIGRGRNDDSVDARIWANKEDAKQPPLILVQCKRQKDTVEKVVVKALHSDVVYEKAALGMVVTSSALSPGAKKVCVARSYPIVEANRDTLKKWIHAMRTPYSGIFLGE